MHASRSGLLVLFAVGCSDTVRGGARDGGPDDASDVPAEVGRDAPGPAVDLCGATGVVDADAVGLRAGGTTTVIVDADALPGGALPPGRCPHEATAQRRLILRYTPPVDGLLRAAAVPFRAPDGVERRAAVALRDGCGPAATELSCASASEVLGSSTRVAAGRPLYLVGALDGGRWSVTLHVASEQGGVGAACGGDRGCAAEHSCVLDRCVPDGSLYTACRSGASPCDPGLTCAEIVPGSGRRRCAFGARLGEPCELPRSVCLEGVCGGRSDARCRLPGNRDAPCRTSGSPCDAGLTCFQGSWCGEARAPGGVCVLWAAGRPCRPGEWCRAVPGGARCLANGANGGLCRTDGSPRCDPGLRCASSTTDGYLCMPSQGEGRPCSLATGTGCDPTTECLPSPDGDGRCVHRGAAGTRCVSTTLNDCDPGLACVPENGGPATRCGSPIAAGQPCGDAWLSCVAGTSCGQAPPGSTSRCIPDGASGGWCRTGASPCDAGLSCSTALRCLPTLAEGQACTPDGPAACAAGMRCEGTCRREGSVGGHCRAGAAPCDEGGACVPSDQLASTCARVIPRGESCAPSATPSVCADGTECVGGPDGARCVPQGSAGAHCLPGSVPGLTCAAGLACLANGLCGTPLREGEICRAAGAAEGACAAGLTCSLLPEAAAHCVVDGTLGASCRTTGAPCEADLTCATVEATGRSVCLRPSSLGGLCGLWYSPCAGDAACVSGRCVATGVAGAPCRASERACDEGLRCVLNRCAATVATGCSPRGPACAAPAECLWDGAAYACARAPYAVEVRRAVAFEDPCLLDAELLTSPLRFRVFGGDFEVSAEGGRVRVVDPGGSLAWLTHGEVTSRMLAGCAAVVGAAPNRRLLMGGGTWATHLTTGVERASNAVVILYEGSNVVEYRYDDPLPETGVDALPAWGAPTLQWTSGGAVYRVTAPVQQFDAGLSVRFTPR